MSGLPGFAIKGRLPPISDDTPPTGGSRECGADSELISAFGVLGYRDMEKLNVGVTDVRGVKRIARFAL